MIDRMNLENLKFPVLQGEEGSSCCNFPETKNIPDAEPVGRWVIERHEVITIPTD